MLIIWVLKCNKLSCAIFCNFLTWVSHALVSLILVEQSESMSLLQLLIARQEHHSLKSMNDATIMKKSHFIKQMMQFGRKWWRRNIPWRIFLKPEALTQTGNFAAGPPATVRSSKNRTLLRSLKWNADDYTENARVDDWQFGMARDERRNRK